MTESLRKEFHEHAWKHFTVHAQQLCQSGKRVHEDLVLAAGSYFELHLGGVIDPAIHAGMIAPPGARVTSRRPG